MTGRIRSIKPEWLEDAPLGRTGDVGRVLSVGLMLVADDYGRGRADEEYLAAQVWPYDPEARAKSASGLARLVAIRFLVVYRVDDQAYFEIRNWAKHQKVSHKGAPRVPRPPEDSGDPPEEIGEPPENLQRIPEILRPDLRSQISDLRSPITSAPEEIGEPPENLRNLTETRHPVSDPALLVARGYQDRWEAATATAWQSYGKHHDDLGAIARWAEAQAKIDGVAATEPIIGRLLDAYWSDAWATSRQWPLGHLARNPGKYLAAPVAGAATQAPGATAAADGDGWVDATREERARLQAEADAAMGRGDFAARAKLLDARKALVEQARRGRDAARKASRRAAE